MAGGVVGVVVTCAVLAVAVLLSYYHIGYENNQRLESFYDVKKLLFKQKSFKFAVISDLDKQSKHPTKPLWQSYLKHGELKLEGNGKYTITWGERVTLTSKTSTKNRGMELSELIRFKGELLVMCDYTGLVQRVDDDSFKLYHRYAVADGNGLQEKPCKLEWATEKV